MQERFATYTTRSSRDCNSSKNGHLRVVPSNSPHRSDKTRCLRSPRWSQRVFLYGCKSELTRCTRIAKPRGVPDSSKLRLFPSDCAVGDMILCDCVPAWDDNQTSQQYQAEPEAEIWVFERTIANLQGFERRAWTRVS